MECLVKKSGLTRRRVASSATAFAPFSQNSAALRFSCSGQAQPMQSNPSIWLTAISVWTLRRGPICSSEIFRALATAGMPTALVLGLLTVSLDSSIFSRGALEAIGSSLNLCRAMRACVD
jgi:hypothetical protein